MSDSSDSEVSSTYRSDEDTKCTCILADEDDSENTKGFSRLSDEQRELCGLHFQDKKGTVYKFPLTFSQLLDTDYKYVVEKLQCITDSTVLLLDCSSLYEPTGQNVVPPDGHLFDMMIISPKMPTLVLTIINHDDKSESVIIYNTQLARHITARVRTNIASYSVVHGVLKIDDFRLDDVRFKSIIQKMVTAAERSSAPLALCMDPDNCRAVVQAIISETDATGGVDINIKTAFHHLGRSKKAATDKFETAGVDGGSSLTEVRSELRMLENQLTTGFPIVPFDMKLRLEEQYPYILERVRKEMNDRNGWVCILNFNLQTLLSAISRPYDVICDVILMAEGLPVKLLTFMNGIKQRDEVTEYNSNLTKAVVDVVQFCVHGEVITRQDTEEKASMSTKDSDMGYLDQETYKTVSKALVKHISDMCDSQLAEHKQNQPGNSVKEGIHQTTPLIDNVEGFENMSTELLLQTIQKQNSLIESLSERVEELEQQTREDKINGNCCVSVILHLT